MKYGHEIAKKVILGLSPQKDNPLQTVSNKMPAFTKSYKMAVWTCRFLMKFWNLTCYMVPIRIRDRYIGTKYYTAGPGT